MLIPCIWLQAINKVKVMHQNEGHIKVKVNYLHPYLHCWLAFVFDSFDESQNRPMQS